MLNLRLQGCLFFSLLYISGIHTVPKPLDTVNVNLNIDQNEPLGLKNAQNGGGVDVGGGQLEGAKEQATGDSSCLYTDRAPNCAELKYPYCTTGEYQTYMMTNCAKTCLCATTTPALPPTTGDSCGFQREQVVYLGCGFTYVEEKDRTAQCGQDSGTSKLIIDSYNGGSSCGLQRAQVVYTGCGYTYLSELDRNQQCRIGSETSKIIFDSWVPDSGPVAPSMPNPLSTETCPKESGFCVGLLGFDQNFGVKKLDSIDGNTMEQETKCLAKCRAYPGATGCEAVWNQLNRGCYAHTQPIGKGNGVGNHACWVFSKCTGTNPSAPNQGLLGHVGNRLDNLGNRVGNNLWNLGNRLGNNLGNLGNRVGNHLRNLFG